MKLHDLIRGILPAQSAPNPRVTALARDSRRVEPGSLFVAVPGTQVDGAAYAHEAARRGAVAVVAQRPLAGLAVPLLRCPDAARALGLLADRFWGEPSREVAVAGVTGTNGKTTTTQLLRWILDHAGRPTSLLGTIENRVAGSREPATKTTPDALVIHEALAATRAAGARDLVMEVSSHGLDQQRTAGVRFRCAAFTNLSRDHLDYHGDLQAYGRAKARLFRELAPDATCVLNRRDPFSSVLAGYTPARVLYYDWSDSPRRLDQVDLGAVLLEESLAGTRLVLGLGRTRAELTLPLIGRFNVENALAAAGLAQVLGVSPRAIAAALACAPGIAGRLERVAPPGGTQPTVLVDFAHTPDALRRVLQTLRPLVRGGRLVVVFGCGGDRDRGKRAPMGRVVERYADRAIVTSDNPRSEAPAAIVREVLAGFHQPRAAAAIIERNEAIAHAIRTAEAGDLVLLAGKGHERVQIVGTRRLPFDDREVARTLLRAA